MIKGTTLLGASWLVLAGVAAAQTVPLSEEQRAARIEELEARLAGIEAQLEDLKESTAADAADIRRVQSDAPRVTLDNGRPTFATADGAFRASIRGLVQYDVASFDEGDNAGGVDLNSGGNFRRARLGIEGTVARHWNYNLTAEYGGTGAESTQLNQAWVEYAGWQPADLPLRLRVGAWATPINLEDATSNGESLFLERPTVAELARSIAAGDGRYGVGAFINGERWSATAVHTGGTIGGTGEFDEQSGYILRAAFLPIRSQNYAVHIGANLTGVLEPADTAAGPATTQIMRLRERPELRNDGTRFVDTGNLSADSATQYGAELGGYWRNFFLAGEWIGFEVERPGTLVDPEFDGWYVQGGWTITGERRQWNAANGGFQGIRPANPFAPSEGHWGAWEIAARQSVLNLNDATAGVAGGEQTINSFGLNWYPNRAIRFLFDYQDVDVENGGGVGGADVDYQAIALRSQLSF